MCKRLENLTYWHHIWVLVLTIISRQLKNHLTIPWPKYPKIIGLKFPLENENEILLIKNVLMAPQREHYNWPTYHETIVVQVNFFSEKENITSRAHDNFPAFNQTSANSSKAPIFRKISQKVAEVTQLETYINIFHCHIQCISCHRFAFLGRFTRTNTRSSQEFNYVIECCFIRHCAEQFTKL